MFYAIDLAHPAVVDAISGVRYAIIFVGAYTLTKLRPQWLRENFEGWTLAGKTAGTLLIVAGLVGAGTLAVSLSVTAAGTSRPAATANAAAYPAPKVPNAAAIKAKKVTPLRMVRIPV